MTVAIIATFHKTEIEILNTFTMKDFLMYKKIVDTSMCIHNYIVPLNLTKKKDVYLYNII